MRIFTQFLRHRHGVVAATTALLMPALILFMALAVEVGEWYTITRQLQSVADAAAVAAAWDLAYSGTLAGATTKATYSAAHGGFGGTPSVTCLVAYNPDVTGPCAPGMATGYVKATVSEQQPTVFASMYERVLTLGAGAVASWTQPYQSCALALGAGGTDITTTGSPTITLGTGCVMASQSAAADSLDLSGASSVTAQTLISAGGINGTCGACTATPVLDGPIIPNPLSCSLAANSGFCSAVAAIPSGCTAMPATIPAPPSGGVCYTSMVFNGTVTLPAGTYYTTGNFDVQGGTVTGTGVTIIVTNAGACEGNISFEGNSTTATLTAPSSGTFAGMLFIQVAPSGVACASTNSIGAGPTTPAVTLAGGIYSPDASWTFDASPSTSCLSGVSPCGNKCLTVISNTIVFGGTVDLEDAGCAAPSGTDLFNVAAISLVE